MGELILIGLSRPRVHMGELREGRGGGPLSAGDDSALSRDIANIITSRATVGGALGVLD